MTSRMSSSRFFVSVCIVAAGALGLSGCSDEKPSGLASYTAGAISKSPSATSTSKWTPEQQQVIDGYDRFNDLMTAFRTNTAKMDLAKARSVAQEPFVTGYLQGISNQLSAGYIDTGKVLSTTSSVSVVGAAATMKTCLDATHTKLVNPGNPSAPPVANRAPNRVNVSLVRQAGSWLVSGLNDGGGVCVPG